MLFSSSILIYGRVCTVIRGHEAENLPQLELHVWGAPKMWEGMATLISKLCIFFRLSKYESWIHLLCK